MPGKSNLKTHETSGELRVDAVLKRGRKTNNLNIKSIKQANIKSRNAAANLGTERSLAVHP